MKAILLLVTLISISASAGTMLDAETKHTARAQKLAADCALRNEACVQRVAAATHKVVLERELAELNRVKANVCYQSFPAHAMEVGVTDEVVRQLDAYNKCLEAQANQVRSLDAKIAQTSEAIRELNRIIDAYNKTVAGR